MARPKFTPDEIRAIRSAPGPQTKIAEAYGVTQGTIAHIRGYRSYAWVSDDPAVPSVRPTGHQFQPRLTDAEVKAIRESVEGPTAVSKLYGITPEYVRHLRVGMYRPEAGGPIWESKKRGPHAPRLTPEAREGLRSDLLEISRLYGVNLYTVAYHAKVLRNEQLAA